MLLEAEARHDGSLGGQYPVICVVLFNPANGVPLCLFRCASSDFGVALERDRSCKVVA